MTGTNWPKKLGDSMKNTKSLEKHFGGTSMQNAVAFIFTRFFLSTSTPGILNTEPMFAHDRGCQKIGQGESSYVRI